jgi:L-seryl-tRNA(Ser) seleniumtransferase
VGTTNKTRLSDYEKAISDRTALLFRAHKSNFSIHGFTEEPSTTELAALAHKHKLPFVFDMGSGLLRRPKRLPLSGEPDVRSALADGADLITFSGDKLIGGPQAGIIVGRAELTSRLARAPLMRALRLGKLDLAALSSACRRYLSDDTLLTDNPAFAMLEQKPGQVKQRAEKLAALLQAQAIPCSVTTSIGRTGGGALPDLEIPSHSVVLTLTGKAGKAAAEKLYRELMTGEKAVVGILKEGELCFDLLTVFDDDVAGLADAITRTAAT